MAVDDRTTSRQTQIGTESETDIGEVVRRTGIKASTLHVWEQHGLILPSARRGLRRQYASDIFERLALIVLCQRAGFTLAEIAGLLTTGLAAEDKGQIVAKLGELRTQRDQLTTAIEGLEHALACPEPSILECTQFTTELMSVLPVDRSD